MPDQAVQEVGMRYAIILGLLLGVPAVAQASCQIVASAKTGQFLKVPIYAGPSSTSEVLGIAPEYRVGTNDPGLGARFVVTEMRNGWARVSEVTDWSGEVPGPDGWIGPMNIMLIPQTRRGFAVASAASQVVWEGEDWPQADGLLDCQGEWGRVRLLPAEGAATITAWVRGFCDDQAKPCEDVTGD
jgi:hypothetical protein